MNSHKPQPSNFAAVSLPQWRKTASAWSEHAELIAQMTRDATDALLQRLGAQAGERIVDLACGPGDPSLRLGSLVAPGGRVLALDGVEEMVRTTAQRAGSAGLCVAPIQSRGEQLPFKTGSVDALTSRFGIMFFDEPLRALEDALRCLRPNGRTVFAVWGPRENNAYFTVTVKALEESGFPAAPLEPGTKTPFEFSEPESLSALLRQAGFENVREETAAIQMRFEQIQPAQLVDVQRMISPSIGERFAELDPLDVERIRQAVAKRVLPWHSNGKLELPGEIFLISGTKPAS